MGYSAQVIARAKQRLADRNTDKQSRAQAALEEAYERLPRLREIDRELRRSMTLAAATAFRQGEDAREAMEQVKGFLVVLHQGFQRLGTVHSGIHGMYFLSYSSLISMVFCSSISTTTSFSFSSSFITSEKRLKPMVRSLKSG